MHLLFAFAFVLARIFVWRSTDVAARVGGQRQKIEFTEQERAIPSRRVSFISL